jgi:hypothetical protein
MIYYRSIFRVIHFSARQLCFKRQRYLRIILVVLSLAEVTFSNLFPCQKSHASGDLSAQKPKRKLATKSQRKLSTSKSILYLSDNPHSVFNCIENWQGASYPLDLALPILKTTIEEQNRPIQLAKDNEARPSSMGGGSKGVTQEFLSYIKPSPPNKRPKLRTP